MENVLNYQNAMAEAISKHIARSMNATDTRAAYADAAGDAELEELYITDALQGEITDRSVVAIYDGSSKTNPAYVAEALEEVLADDRFQVTTPIQQALENALAQVLDRTEILSAYDEAAA